MTSFQRTGAALSSFSLRLLAFIFFRWIPGHPFPPIIYSLFLIYVGSFCYLIYSNADSSSLRNGVKSLNKINREPSYSNGHVGQTKLHKATERKPQIFTTLLTGLPSPSSTFSNVVTFAINVALVVLVGFCVYTPSLVYPSHTLSFARIGYVSESSAKVFVREPDPSQLPMIVSFRCAETSESPDAQHRRCDADWKAAGSFDTLTEDTDFTATLTISNLEPDTRYQYALSNKHSGFFITAPLVGKISQRNNQKFSFLHTSCIIPNFPYDPFAHPLTIHGFHFLSQWISRLKPAFLLFLGDFIYIDVPARHGSDAATYRKQYRHVYASPDWPSVSMTSQTATYEGDDYDVPWLHTYDDHEIANDWSGNTTGYFRAAFDPYLHYHLKPNPPLPASAKNPSTDLSTAESALKNQPATYTSFTQGPATFFFLDTRRYRQPPSPQLNTSMLGTAQRTALLTWLKTPTPPGVTWKILVSSVPFTKNWRVNAQDTWAGYLAERRILLEAMWDAASAPDAGGIVVLSGDRHEFAATAFPAPQDEGGGRWNAKATVYEFSTSPLSQFYLPVHTYRQDPGASVLSRVLGTGPTVEEAGPARLRATEEDVCLKYIPDGNTKFGAVEIEAPAGNGTSLLRYRLFVDGVEVWSHVLNVGGP